VNDVTESARRDEQNDGAIEPERVDKRVFIRQMAKEADIPLYVAAQAYEAFIKTLFDNVRAGNQVNLTGFGKFYFRRHGGHQVQFGAGEKPDYSVLKFSATRRANDFLDLVDDQAKDMRVPGTRVRNSESVGKAHSKSTPEDQAETTGDEEFDNSAQD
jgi:nucleoid DNA-binding protein